MNTSNTNNNNFLNSDATAESFLTWLRRSWRLFARFDDQTKGHFLIKHQQDFPRKIQEEIRRLSEGDVSPRILFRRAIWAIRQLLLCTGSPGIEWAGLDSEVDTEEQLEIAIRIFPDVMRFTLGTHPLYCVTTCRKSLSFAPLLAELAMDLNDDNHLNNVSPYSPVLELFVFRPPPGNDDYERELDSMTLSALMRLRKKRNTRKLDGWIRFIVHKSFELNHIRIEKTLRLVLDWSVALDWSLSLLKHGVNQDLPLDSPISRLPIRAWNDLPS